MDKIKRSGVFTYGILIFLMVLFLFLSFSSPYFLTVDNLTKVLRQIAVVGIVTVSMTMVILTGGIDLSVGSILGLTSVILAKLMVAGVSVPIAIIITLISGMGLGLFNGFLINKIKISPLISTLGTMTIYSGITYIVTKGVSIFGFPKSFSFIGQGYILGVPVPIIILVIVYIFGFFILNYTRFGRYLYGIGANEKASILSGVDVVKIKYVVYILSGLLASLASVVMLSRINSALPSTGVGLEFDVVTAVVLGGISVNGGEGKLQGVVIGLLIIAILSNGMILLGVDTYFQTVVKGAVLLMAVGIDNISKK
ncbi:ABC transporter permease [Tissierella creatinophila]|uniref:Ribose transport system permease protein RbsC n=1 Tax=Tissierella creatinophila DSM 6911 TaxID=1123403 RepID=A0A1U7M8Y7_TISCR|nr:ribose ABC transporter permease [Tissierella creatinophila]OLS03793.1 ribose transport system permease protein RbsC [Tissierella creatinophila DSM 6911]